MDVIVSGKGVRGGALTAQDFSIQEDNRPQTIVSVLPPASDGQASPRHLVLLFDPGSMPLAGRAASREYAAHFIDSAAASNRYMAVMGTAPLGPVVVQDFTESKVALIRAVLSVPANVVDSARFADNLSSVCRSLSAIPGRKHLVVFTGGYANTSSTMFDSIVEECNKSDVAVYAAGVTAGTPAGMHPTGPMMGGTCVGCSSVGPTVYSSDLQNQNLDAAGRTLAEGTGGATLDINSPQFSQQLISVANDLDQYYRLFYVPPQSKEGSCHKIRVDLKIRGAAARARNEYCTDQPVDSISKRVSLHASSVDKTGVSSQDFLLQTPYFYSGGNQAVVHLVASIPVSGMKFSSDQTGFHGEVDVVGTALRPDSSAGAHFAEAVHIHLSSRSELDSFLASPYRYEREFSIAPGLYTMQMLAVAEPGTVKTSVIPLRIDPLNSGNLSISDIALGTVRRPLTPSKSALLHVEGAGPLISGDTELEPGTSNRFSASDPAYFYLEVYDPVLARIGMPTAGALRATTVPIMVEYCVFAGNSSERKFCSEVYNLEKLEQPGNPVVRFSSALPVSQLATGSYRLEFRAVSPANAFSASRATVFEIR